MNNIVKNKNMDWRVETVFIVMALGVALSTFVRIGQTQISGQDTPAHDTADPRDSMVKVVHVNSSADDSSCFERDLKPQYYVCQTLEAAYQSIAADQSIEVVIKVVEPVILSSVVTFNNLSSIKLTAASSDTRSTIQCDIRNSSVAIGFEFLNIQNITIENLNISHCGTYRQYSKHGEVNKETIYFTFRAAIHVKISTNILIANAVFMHNNGAGMVILDGHGGIVAISECIFDHNKIPEKDLHLAKSYAGGGGVLVIAQKDTGNPTEFIFRDCQFVSNRQTAEYNKTFLTAFGSKFSGSGHGGGLEIRMKRKAAYHSFTIINCTFSNNTAFTGAGLAVTMRWESHNNSVIIQNSTFTENGCQGGSGIGGGALFGYMYTYKFDGSGLHKGNDNNINITDVIFRENCAEGGGGGTAVYSSYSKYRKSTNTIVFSNCSWIANKARVGAAIDVSPQIADRLSGGQLPPIELTDCEFIDNRVTDKTQGIRQAFGIGTFYSSLLDISFRSSVKFVNNSGSAFIIVNGVADFRSCDAEFTNNTGVQGGAIALIGTSSMIIGQDYDCTMNFTQNHASDSGGAIYSSLVDEHDFSMSKTCFIQHLPVTVVSKWNTSFIFQGNWAKNYGHSIYSTSLLPCQVNCSNNQTAESSSFIFTSCARDIFRFLNNTMENQIATDVARFESEENEFHLIPGKKYILNVLYVDDMNQTVNSSVRASIDSVDRGTLKVDEAFSYVSGNSIKLLGENGASGKLLIQTVSLRKNSIVVNVTLSQCPPGFRLEENECKCDAHSYIGLTRCSNDQFQTYLLQGFWAGYVSNRSEIIVFATTLCPLGFCNYNKSGTILLPQNSSKLDNLLCGPNRTGILCGNCTSGRTVYYNSPFYSCRVAELCKYGWLFYLLSELVPVTILFIIVLTFNISFTSGGINGFILFSQLLDTLLLDGSGAIEIPSKIHSISLGYHLFYGLFSLNFFNIEPLSFCLWNGATVLDVLAFKYVTIAYSLVLIVSVIMFMRHCAPKLLGKHYKISVLRNSVIHGISAFVMVCYAQCVKVSLHILYRKVLQGRNGEQVYPTRVWLSGEIEYFSRQHMSYAVLAILFLTTVGIVPPVLLIAYPLLNKIMAFCRVDESYPVVSLSKKIPIYKLKPLLDSFQGCFKDDLRFFAGLYFLYRWIGLVTYVASVNIGGCYAIIEIMLIVILLVHAVVQPYASRWHNTIDTLLLSNLALLNGFTAFNYYYSTVNAKGVRKNTMLTINASFQLVLIYLPLLLCLVSFIWTIFSKFCLAWSGKMKKSEGIHGQDCIPLEDFPARLLDDMEYEESPERLQVDYENFIDRDSN